MTELVKFYETCESAKVVPLPIFVKIQEGLLFITNEFINDGMANALAKLLTFGLQQDNLKIVEVNLDTNGLKDESFSKILEVAATHPTLQVINYSNNQLGAKSVA